MKLKITILAASFALGLIFTSCNDKAAGKPSFFTKNDSINKKPAMGDSTNPNQTGN